MIALKYFPANQAHAFVFGKDGSPPSTWQMLRIVDGGPMFYRNKRDAVKTAEGVGIRLDKHGIAVEQGSFEGTSEEPPGGPASGFNRERTQEDYEARIVWERWAAAQARKKGAEATATEHLLAARRYYDELKRKFGESKRQRKYDYLWVLQGHYGHGWEDLTASENRREVQQNLREYRENEGGRYRIIRRREARELEGVEDVDIPDEFTQQYIETALWSSTDNSDDSGGEPLDSNYDILDFDEKSLRKMIKEAQRFKQENAKLLAVNDDEGQGGHDFWLTRNGHGAGFWDGDWPEPQASKLTEASKRYGEQNIYVGDDGKLYVD